MAPFIRENIVNELGYVHTALPVRIKLLYHSLGVLVGVLISHYLHQLPQLEFAYIPIVVFVEYLEDVHQLVNYSFLVHLSALMHRYLDIIKRN